MLNEWKLSHNCSLNERGRKLQRSLLVKVCTWLGIDSAANSCCLATLQRSCQTPYITVAFKRRIQIMKDTLKKPSLTSSMAIFYWLLYIAVSYFTKRWMWLQYIYCRLQYIFGLSIPLPIIGTFCSVPFVTDSHILMLSPTYQWLPHGAGGGGHPWWHMWHMAGIADSAGHY